MYPEKRNGEFVSDITGVLTSLCSVSSRALQGFFLFVEQMELIGMAELDSLD